MTSPAYAERPADLVDLDFVAQLIDAIGQEDFDVIVGTLEKEVEAQVMTLQESTLAGETARAKQSAHRLAGLLSQFGAFEVTQATARLQQAQDDAEVRGLATSLEKLCRASMNAITDLQRSLPMS